MQYYSANPHECHFEIIAFESYRCEPYGGSTVVGESGSVASVLIWGGGGGGGGGGRGARPRNVPAKNICSYVARASRLKNINV